MKNIIRKKDSITIESEVIDRVESIFRSIFVIQNRIQNAGEKLHTDISMRQWLLIAMIESCKKERTLTNIGSLMGCSRQNVKKLALALEKNGFVLLKKGSNNSLLIELTEKSKVYSEKIEPIVANALKLLFLDFSEEEIEQLYRFYFKLFRGIERVENYAEEVLMEYV